MRVANRRIVAFALMSMTTSAAMGQTQHQIEWCQGQGSPSLDQQISGCTAVAESGKYGGKPLALAFYYRGRAYNSKKDYERAVVDFDRAITIDPSFAGAFFSRAVTRANIAYRDRSSYDRAVQDYDEAIRLKPTNSDAYLNRGSIYLHTARYERAIQDYSRAIQLEPKESDAFLGRAITYYDSGEYVQAVSDFTAAINLDPKDIVSLYGRGLAKKKSGDATGEIDIAAAKKQQPDIDNTFKSYGGK